MFGSVIYVYAAGECNIEIDFHVAEGMSFLFARPCCISVNPKGSLEQIDITCIGSSFELIVQCFSFEQRSQN
jgi:hypothetical protein